MSENEGAKEIRGFFGPYRFLSNFYPSPIKYGVNTYPTAEHLYQALKTKDKEKRVFPVFFLLTFPRLVVY